MALPRAGSGPGESGPWRRSVHPLKSFIPSTAPLNPKPWPALRSYRIILGVQPAPLNGDLGTVLLNTRDAELAPALTGGQG